MAHILIVDDEPDIRGLLQRVVERREHTVDFACNGREGVERVLAGEYDLILTDVRMPEMDGLDFLREVQERIAFRTPCVILTAFHEAGYAIEATRLGVRDFLVKPFEISALDRAVQAALELREDWRFRYERERWLETERAKLERELRDTLESFVSEFGELLESSVNAKDHCRRVADMTVRLCRAMGEHDEARLQRIRMGAILHDIGKVRIDPLIFRKGRDEPLTESDWEQIRKHPEIGARIVERVPRLAHAATIIRCHHEKFDGTGYPRGIEGDGIPLEARIFAVTDAYDCMVDEHRTYKPRKAPRAALDELKRCRGMHFDPRIVAVFEECVYPDLEREWARNGGHVPVNGQVRTDFSDVVESSEPVSL